MTSRIASRRMASLPSRLEKIPAPARARTAGNGSSPTELAAKVVLGALLVFMGLTFVALAPMTIAVLVALAGVSGLLALVGRHRYTEPRARRPARRWWPRSSFGWGTLATSSVALLVLALVMPRGYDVLFAVLGLLGMVVLRLRGKPRAPLEDGPDARGPTDASVSNTRRYELGEARFSASDRPIPREWRRRHSTEPFAHAVG